MTTLQCDAVAHSYFSLQNCWVRAVSDMDDGVVLHVRPITNANVMDVAPHAAVTPDRRLFAKVHITNYLCAMVHKCGWMNLRLNTAKRPDHYLRIVTYGA